MWSTLGPRLEWRQREPCAERAVGMESGLERVEKSNVVQEIQESSNQDDRWQEGYKKSKQNVLVLFAG
ncbi:hypothetical protein MA16_Dca001687 [Dendrobium catenatum]|uniref:Uncharacterized protein n=1 Tax=Dendrobium catenatum TaxID=906689 RepID=A0A2I0WN60_9ASPA|nr:hypothetical protein MA16_Dca001687 [Dendrobium catenatum]